MLPRCLGSRSPFTYVPRRSRRLDFCLRSRVVRSTVIIRLPRVLPFPIDFSHRDYDYRHALRGDLTRTVYVVTVVTLRYLLLRSDGVIYLTTLHS